MDQSEHEVERMEMNPIGGGLTLPSECVSFNRLVLGMIPW